MKYRININDKNNNPVYVGDIFETGNIDSSNGRPIRLKVVKDLSKENIDCDRDFNVEDEEGNRIWNAYIVIKDNCKLK